LQDKISSSKMLLLKLKTKSHKSEKCPLKTSKSLSIILTSSINLNNWSSSYIKIDLKTFSWTLLMINLHRLSICVIILIPNMLSPITNQFQAHRQQWVHSTQLHKHKNKWRTSNLPSLIWIKMVMKKLRLKNHTKNTW